MLKLRQDGTIPRGDYVANEIHAHQLASRIRAYWRGKGHANVTVWAEPLVAGKGEAAGVKLHGVKDNVFWQVRSNLVNGLPPKL